MKTKQQKHYVMLFLMLFGIALSIKSADNNTATEYDNVTATWDFTGNCAGLAAKGASGSELTATTIASTVAGIDLTVVYNGGQVRNNDNSYQVTKGVVFQVPVKSSRDIVTVNGYSGYSSYAYGESDEAQTNVSQHRATPAEAEQGYVEVRSLMDNNYYNSISVSYWSGYEDKVIYSTDFKDWDALKASSEEKVVSKQTKYSHETLTFTLVNFNVNDGDIDLAGKFNNRPVGWLTCPKDPSPAASIVTSPLASITTVRFVQGATGGNRGVKLEAKGDGDADWVVISDAVANPAAWHEITAEVNRQNCQLRFTNLAPSQYAYIFELEISGMVDMSKAPILNSFNVNGETVNAGELFDQNANGDYVATIEVRKTDAMISEANPLTEIVPANGTVGTIIYKTTGEGINQQTVATIPVTANGETVNYVATFVFKPDRTLTYVDTDGVTILGTQDVEKDAAIGNFAVDYAKATAGEGQKVRGWFVNADGGRKFTTEDVITEDLMLYAVATEIETQSSTARYTYQLGNQYFYPEDHEGFNPEGTGYWHDSTHGWAFAPGDKIGILVGGKANITLGLCQYSAGNKILLSNSKGEVIDEIATDKAASDGAQTIFAYEGEADALTLTYEGAGSSYLHSLTIANLGESPYEKNGQWYIVKAGDATSLINTLEAVNGANNGVDAERAYIYLPDGIYDLGETCLTAVSGNNISIIGQSMDNTIVRNAPKIEDEGIGKTATFLVSGKNTYFQDLTIQNALDYYNSGSAGRAVCIQDVGNRTICKNVRLLSYQDTYYTSNNDAQLYWETSDIHGTVDFICGGGDVRFQDTQISLEPRQQNGGGGRTISAATTTGKFGYVFDGCTIVDLAVEQGIQQSNTSWNFSRTWQNDPIVVFLNTTIKHPETLVATRWTEKGMNNRDPKVFGEFNSKDAQGNNITPASNIIKSYTVDVETILSAEQAAAFAYDKMFTDWDPAALAAQVQVTSAKYADGTIKWQGAADIPVVALFKNGEFVTITDATSYVVEDADKASWTIRAANQMGGFGPATQVEGTVTRIEDVANDESGTPVIYNLQGVRVQQATKGIYIINGKKVVKYDKKH
ncbi:MAG: pectin esterase [Prevotellaceae bacterium]|nr:pectin esterase [Prevotellaceae bacterium]